MKPTPLQIRYNVLVNHNFEKIADYYAIEFAEWIHNNCVYYDGWNVRVQLGDKYSDVYNIEGLLEIFKKEKGL